jgi:hypothetical protein
LDHEFNALRVKQAAVLTDFTRTLPPDIPRILTGDFNSGDGSQPITAIKSGAWLDSYAAIHGPAEPGMTAHAFLGDNHPSKATRKKIDFVFHNSLLAPATAEIIKDSRDGKYPSDHYFVSGELKYTLPIVPYRNGDEFLLYALSNNYTVVENTIIPDIPGGLAHLPRVGVTENNKLGITFLPAKDELIYEVQQSADLQSWETTETLGGNSAQTSPLTKESPTPTSDAQKLFLRLKISPYINPGE